MKLKYGCHITADLQPRYVDEEIAVVGINTARSLTIQDGRVNDRQIEHARRELAGVGDHLVKIIVTHHPFDLPPGPQHHGLVGQAVPAMRAFASTSSSNRSPRSARAGASPTAAA